MKTDLSKSNLNRYENAKGKKASEKTKSGCLIQTQIANKTITSSWKRKANKPFEDEETN